MDPLTKRPPCWLEGRCPHTCAAAHYQRVIYNHTALHGPWSGWRMAGHRLVSPRREWIHPGELDHVLYMLRR